MLHSSDGSELSGSYQGPTRPSDRDWESCQNAQYYPVLRGSPCASDPLACGLELHMLSSFNGLTDFVNAR